MTRFIGYFSAVYFALSVAFVSAKETPSLVLKPGAPTTYTVSKGDTLWDISAMYLNDPWLWPQLWDINSGIENPNLIYPGDKLFLVWKNGKPQLRFKPKVILSPEVRKLVKDPIAVIEERLVLSYLQSDRLISKEALIKSSRVLGNNKNHQYLTDLDPLYFTGHHTHLRWGIYRPAEEYLREDILQDESSRNKQSVVALRIVATGELIQSYAEKEVSALLITEQLQEVRQNDLVLPLVDSSSLGFTTTFFPSPSPPKSVAKILGSLEGSQYMAQSQVVVLDKGAEDGLKQGSMFEIYQTGSLVYGKQGQFSYEQGWFQQGQSLLSHKIGEVMVIRPYPGFSLALVTSSLSAIGKDVVLTSPLDSANLNAR